MHTLPPPSIAGAGDLLEGLFWLVMVVVYFVIQIVRATAKARSDQVPSGSRPASGAKNGLHRELEDFLSRLSEQQQPPVPTPPRIHINSIRPAPSPQKPVEGTPVRTDPEPAKKGTRFRDPVREIHSDPEPPKAPVVAPVMDNFRKMARVRSSMRNLSSLQGLRMNATPVRGISEQASRRSRPLNLQDRRQLKKALLASFILEKPKALQQQD